MKIALVVLAAVLVTTYGYPADVQNGVLLSRIARDALPEPRHHHHGYGGYGGGYGGGFGGGYGGYGGPGGFGGYGRPGGYGGYPGGYGGGFSGSSAHAGSISSPFGSASFASAKAGSAGYGR